ncbi:MAG: hypothetical protein WAU58_06820 [Terriglobales bacterium]
MRIQNREGHDLGRADTPLKIDLRFSACGPTLVETLFPQRATPFTASSPKTTKAQPKPRLFSFSTYIYYLIWRGTTPPTFPNLYFPQIKQLTPIPVTSPY